MSKSEQGDDPADPVSDAHLVVRAQGGERNALEVLVRRHQRSVFRLCLRYVHDADEAADLVQRTFMRAIAKLGELRQAERFRTWLLRIGANLALNHLRDHARFVSEEAGVDATHATDATDTTMTAAATAAGTQRLEDGETAAALHQAVAGLATRQRMTLELRIYEELSFRQIADALDTTEGAAKVNFHYAVRNLRARLGPGHELGGRGTSARGPRGAGEADRSSKARETDGGGEEEHK